MKAVFSISIILLFSSVLISQNDEISQIIKNKTENTSIENPVNADGIILYNQEYIPGYYRNSGYKPSWTNEKNIDEIILILKDAYSEGLMPEDYHLDRIGILQNKPDTPENLADLDLILTDAAMLYARHLFVGKVDQSKIRKGWDIPPNGLPTEAKNYLESALQSMALSSFYESIKPDHFMYEHMRSGLANYRMIREQGGWPKIPEGKVLKPDNIDERVPIIRNYLKITGDLQSDSHLDNDTEYDSITVEAVKRFQWRHNLNQDGIIGKGTLAVMNVPVDKRIEDLRINLERARWIVHHLPEDFLVVNIAGYNIRRIINDSTVYYSRVIVGKHYHETPIFDGSMTYIEINPTWTLPYSIATKETLPKLKKNPEYLKEKKMIILDRDGKEVDPSTINFQELSRKNFPYTLRQKAGPHNALGEVKFMFPNHYAVYLHDTPARSLFSREERAFSHGCIRLDKKWELFLNLMGDEWRMERINEILESEKTTVVKLKTPIEIILLYWTAGADIDDNLFFNKDIYDRDAIVIKELNKPVVFKKIK